MPERPDEIEIARIVQCPGYNRLMTIETCEECTHCVKIGREEIKQKETPDSPEKVVDVVEGVHCSYPRWLEVVNVGGLAELPKKEKK